MDSSYHFVDDDEIFKLTDALQQQSLLSLITEYVTNDLEVRYRPLFYIIRITGSWIFGVHFMAWSVWTALLAGLSLVIFYAAMRNLRFDRWQSLLFVALTFMGVQFMVFWRIGFCEAIGMPLLGMALFFMSRRRGRHTVNTWLFSVCLILASLIKESFTIIVPAFLVFKIWYEKNEQSVSFKQALRQNAVLVLPFLVMLFNLWVIITYVGTNKTYYGVSPDPVLIIDGIYVILRYQIEIYLGLIAMLLFLLYYELKDESKFLKRIKELLPAFAFGFLVIIPNIVLHAKTGLYDRYYMPMTLGLAFVIIALLRAVRLEFKWLSHLVIGFILIFTLKQIYFMYGNAREWAVQCRQTGNLVAMLETAYTPGTRAVIVAEPVGDGGNISTLTYYLKRKNVHFRPNLFPILPDYSHVRNPDLKRFYQSTLEEQLKGYSNRMYTDLEGEAEIIVFFNTEYKPAFFSGSGLAASAYMSKLPFVDTGHFDLMVPDTPDR